MGADTELAERVRLDRLIGPDQAAEHLEIRRTDFEYVLAAGWLAPVQWVRSQISGRRWVDVGLYRTADVEAVLDVPGVDWEQVRATKPGQPSPLREFAALPTDRGTLVRGFAADLDDRYGIVVRARYDDRRDEWELRWTPNASGEPTREVVRAKLRKDAALREHQASIVLRVDEPAAPDMEGSPHMRPSVSD